MKKTIVILSVLSIGSVALFFLWTKILWKPFKSNHAGSYEYAETWKFNVKESALIKIIQEIKNEHPELEVPNYGLPTEIRHEYWYNIVFYYDDTNQNVYTWTRPNANSSNTTFALVSIAHHNNKNAPSDSMKLDSREINRDFEYFENKREIKKFQEKIIKLIQEKIIKK